MLSKVNCVPIRIDYWIRFTSPSIFFDFQPLVYLVVDEISRKLLAYENYLRLISANLGVPSALIAQNIGMLAGQFETADYCVTSDIEFLPMRIDYFKSLTS